MPGVLLGISSVSIAMCKVHIMAGIFQSPSLQESLQKCSESMTEYGSLGMDDSFELLTR